MNRATDRDVIVVGGGISGLTAAWALTRAGLRVTLLEREPAAGGCLQSVRQDGVLLEKGPFNVLVRDPEFHDLLAAGAADLDAVTAAPDSRRRFIRRGETLHEVPTSPVRLLRSPLLSGRGKRRLVRGMLAGRPSPVEEPTIHEAAERRFGPEVAETFVSSIVAGVFGGDSRRLSLKACLPKAWRFDQEAGSPIAFALRRRRQRRTKAEARTIRPAGVTPARPCESECAAGEGNGSLEGSLVSFGLGLAGLPAWLARRLGPDLVTGCRVDSITRDEAVYVVCGRTTDGVRTYRGRHLLLATPKDAAADLLRSLAPEASGLLDTVESASLVVLNLVYPAACVRHPMSGYGFLVPADEPGDGVMGVLWADSAFPHHSPSGDRIVRVFMGGPRDARAVDRDDEDLLREAHRSLDSLLGLSGAPRLVDVCRWPDCIPQYAIGHADRVDRLLDVVGARPGLHLAGNYLRGVSINDCIREATRTAARIAAEVGARPAPGAVVSARVPSFADRRAPVGAAAEGVLP